MRFDQRPVKADLGFPSALWQAAEIRALLDAARPLTADDLEPPGQTGARASIKELTRRLEGLVKDLQAAADDLEAAKPADLAARTLAAARFGVSGTVPVTDLGDLLDDDLAARTAGICEQLRARAKALGDALAGDSAAALADAGRAAMGATIRLLPLFEATDRGALDTAIAASTALLGGDPLAADDFLLDAAQVRAPLARLTSALASGRTMRADPAELAAADFAAVQVPTRAGDRWLGLPGTPETGRLSLLAHAPDLGGRGDPVAGLHVDEWVEVVPEPDVVTGLTFHAAAPVAAAPQAVLLATPPDAQATWSLDALEAILLETLEQAKLRLVDLDALADGGALAPAAWLAFNADADTVSTDPRAAMRDT